MRQAIVLTTAVALALAGCGREQPATKPEDVRLVRTLTVGADGAGRAATLAGEVRSRYETRLAFRVGGKLVERKADLGASVKRGQVLARLDPADLRLAEAAQQAQVAAARSERELTEADLARFRELRERNFISQAELDRRESLARSANARFDAARAQSAASANQAGYATLVADQAGIVTALEAEAGQVVAAGQTVVRLARADTLEVAVQVAENQLPLLKPGMELEVTLWPLPGQSFKGRVREVGQSADAATRTYPVRISLVEAGAQVRLGMTANVRLPRDGDDGVAVPLPAVFEKGGDSFVWRVDPKVLTVSAVPVRVAGYTGNLARVSGLGEGDVVVTAGANLLVAGQRVKLAGAAP